MKTKLSSDHELLFCELGHEALTPPWSEVADPFNWVWWVVDSSQKPQRIIEKGKLPKGEFEAHQESYVYARSALERAGVLTSSVTSFEELEWQPLSGETELDNPPLNSPAVG